MPNVESPGFSFERTLNFHFDMQILIFAIICLLLALGLYFWLQTIAENRKLEYELRM